CAFANASRNGVFAARLAKAGMTGAAPIFEGEMGFWKQVSGPFELGVEGFGGNNRPFMIDRTYIKFYPAEYHSQSAIDAALSLRAEILDDGRPTTDDRPRMADDRRPTTDREAGNQTDRPLTASAAAHQSSSVVGGQSSFPADHVASITIDTFDA